MNNFGPDFIHLLVFLSLDVCSIVSVSSFKSHRCRWMNILEENLYILRKNKVKWLILPSGIV